MRFLLTVGFSLRTTTHPYNTGDLFEIPHSLLSLGMTTLLRAGRRQTRRQRTLSFWSARVAAASAAYIQFCRTHVIPTERSEGGISNNTLSLIIPTERSEGGISNNTLSLVIPTERSEGGISNILHLYTNKSLITNH
jgi:hypothetical protein